MTSPIAPVASGFAVTVRRPVATTMAVIAIATFGWISFGKIPLALLPEISYPTITVRTEYEGAGPEDIEERISRRVEEALAVLPGLENYSSVSRAGVSDVVLEFRWGTNLSFATQEVRERLDRVSLPDDTEQPLILRYDPSLDPILRVAVSGDADLREIRLAADELVARKIATVPGVAAVKVRGGLEEEIRVRLDAERLTHLGLDISEVDRRLKIENVNLASGTLVEGDTEYVVRTLNQFRTLDELLDLAIVDREGSPIRLRDIGTVDRSHRDRDVITRVDGNESVELLIYREADFNIVALADAVQDKLFGTDEQRAYLAALASGAIVDPEVRLKEALLREEATQKDAAKPDAGRGRDRTSGGMGGGMGGFSMESAEITALRTEVQKKKEAQDALVLTLPRGLSTRVLSDQSVFIESAIADVKGAAVSGGVLSILVLLLFLRNLAATTIIAISIPLSVITTFAPMFLLDTTLNIMSLGGLALGIGMLVDNSIVVLESIYRCREEGDEPAAAAIRGTTEVGLAVLASTLTTVAVFFPIVFVSGVAGQIFGDQALTVVCSLLSSLAVAVYFIPMLAARGLKSMDAPKLELQDALRRPLAAIGSLASPLVLWNRTIAFRGIASALDRGSGLRLALSSLILVPLFLVQFGLEWISRLLLVIVFFALFVVRVVAGGLLWVARILTWPFQRAFEFGFDGLTKLYPRSLRMVLKNGAWTLLVMLLTGAAAYAGWRGFGALGREMLPTVHQGELVVHAFLPVGTPLNTTADVLLPFEREFRTIEGVETVAAAIGVPRDEVAEPDEGPHSGRLFVKLRPSDDVAAAEQRVQDAMRARLATSADLDSFRFSRPTLFSVKAPIVIEARTNELPVLRAVAERIGDQLKSMPGLSDVRSTVQSGSPEIRLSFDREKLRRYGLDLEAISNRIRAQVQGVVSTRFAEGERRIDVRVKSDVESLAALEKMIVNRGRAMNLSDTLDRGQEGGGASTGSGSASIRDRTLIPSLSLDLGGGSPIPLAAVANVNKIEGPAEIRRINGQRAAVLTANTVGFDLGGAIDSIRAVLGQVESEFPAVVAGIGGQGAEMSQSLTDMRMALLLAVFLVYIVMASQFESIIQPLVILFTIPLAVVGAVLALEWSDTPLSVVVLIGAVVLAGIVVNNAIVLLDYANQLRARGMSSIDALVTAGQARLRPIFMTTATTVLGLIPITGCMEWIPGIRVLPEAFWRGSELQAPLAITVIGGLTLSTLLTLVVIPAIDHMVHQLRGRAGAATSPPTT
ncbi:MAG: efflux RND transporter permease subunit [Planctomycetes bacterium]|nr:efflux RND transporter permease subunit [Planctomycetota bacterium]